MEGKNLPVVHVFCSIDLMPATVRPNDLFMVKLLMALNRKMYHSLTVTGVIFTKVLYFTTVMASTRLGKLVRNCDEPVTDLKPYEINILKIIHGMCGQE